MLDKMIKSDSFHMHLQFIHVQLDLNDIRRDFINIDC